MISDATMSSPLFVPDSLKFYVNRLSFSKNRVRLQALSSTKASSGSQVIVRLPSNTMINLASLTMCGRVRAYFNNDLGTDTTNGCALPTNWDFSFIETLSLIANGGIITQPFVNYKLLGHILNDVYGNHDQDCKRAALQGSLPQPIQARTGTAAAQGGWLPFSINNWISATQTMAPSYISTNLLGDLELRLTMADDSIVQAGKVANNGAAANTPTWEMEDINFYIETASIGNNLVDQAVAAKLAAGEPINVPFENVFSFSQANAGAAFTQRFSVSSQSVNKILVTTQLDADLGAGPNKKFKNGIPQVFRRNFNGVKAAQFSVNNQYSPNYQIDSNITLGYNPIDETNNNNFQLSNALVETRAAMDIPDYDYDCADKLCSLTQMPLEFFGAGDYFDGANSVFRKLQPGSGQLYANTTTQVYTLPNLAFAEQVTGGVLVRVATADSATTLAEWTATGWTGAAKPAVGDHYFADAASDDTGASTVEVVAVDQEKKSTSYWEPYQHKYPLNTYLEDKFVLATSFDFDVSDKDRLVSGINTLGSNAQMFYNSIGDGGDKNQSTVYVLCTSMVQIYAGATLKIIQ
jgi:hypothetical protein